MSLRLRNQNNSKKTLILNNETWFRILELAEDYGWVPMGTLLLEWWHEAEPTRDGYNPSHWFEVDAGDEGRLVVLEDALNLADALGRAFLEYEPEPELIHQFIQVAIAAPLNVAIETRPSIGAIVAVMDFCQLGAFWIERYA